MITYLGWDGFKTNPAALHKGNGEYINLVDKNLFPAEWYSVEDFISRKKLMGQFK